MISNTTILQTITHLDALYQKNHGAIDGLYFAKLATLEVCGWIEESMDSIVLSYATRHLTDSGNIDYTRSEIIKKTHSFDYDRFRLMLMRVIGIILLEKLEMSLNTAKLSKMKGSLSILKDRRDQQAHTHIKGRTVHIDAPSVTARHFQNVYDGLIDIESLLHQIKI